MPIVLFKLSLIPKVICSIWEFVRQYFLTPLSRGHSKQFSLQMDCIILFESKFLLLYYWYVDLHDDVKNSCCFKIKRKGLVFITRYTFFNSLTVVFISEYCSCDNVTNKFSAYNITTLDVLHPVSRRCSTQEQ